jgi:uncharacterized phage protein gp47/JayE
MNNLRPKLSDIITRIENDARSRLTSEELRRSDLSVFIRVIAGVSHSIYAALDYYKNQLFSDSAETAYLERRASIFNLTRKTATKATGEVKFNYYNDVVDVPVGTLLQSQSGIQYQTTSSPNSEGITSVKAILSGKAYNLNKGNTLDLVNSLKGVANAIVHSDIAGGIDAETDDELRQRILFRTQEPPRQGTKADYIAWAKEVTGVGFAWCFPKELGVGTVTVRFLCNDYSMPDTALINKVQKHLESKASVLAAIYAVAPVEQKINFKLKITPSTLAVRNAAVEAIHNLFKSEAEPGGTIYLSHIHLALSSVADEIDHTIIEPATDVVAQSNSYLPTVGDITWEE